PQSPRLKASMSKNTGSSSHCPVVGFFLRLFTANPNLATLPPLENVRISGSRVKRPINITLFKLAMEQSPEQREGAGTAVKPNRCTSTFGKRSIVYIRQPPACKVGVRFPFPSSSPSAGRFIPLIIPCLRRPDAGVRRPGGDGGLLPALPLRGVL